MKTIAVILCGGFGSRLWPLSRYCEPKQFHAFTGDTSLLAETVKRAENLNCIDEILIVSSASHQHLLPSHVKPFTSKPVHYLLEPIARNTAGAIAVAAHYAMLHLAAEDSGCLVVMPSDHHITDASAFKHSILKAIAGAQTGRLLTLGVVPNSPETGYGYIQRGALLLGTQCHEVLRFVEKPTLDKAIELIANPDFAWNSGIFVFQVKTILDEVHHFEPQIYGQSLAAVRYGTHQQGFFMLDLPSLETCPSKSVDYAVFECSKKIAIATMTANWSDLGSWKAVSDLAKAKTAATDQAPVICVDATNNYVHATKAVAIVGLNDILVIDSPDALLITHKDQSQSVKSVVDQLNRIQPRLIETRNKVRLSWGTYESINQGNTYQVRHIAVDPGGNFALQSSENCLVHWVVVSGQATVTLGDSCEVYQAGQHIYIENQQTHCLENVTQEIVSLVEVQIVIYPGKDDSKRLDSVYSRVAT